MWVKVIKRARKKILPTTDSFGDILVLNAFCLVPHDRFMIPLKSRFAMKNIGVYWELFT